MLDVMKELGALEGLKPAAGIKNAWYSYTQHSGSEFRGLFFLASDNEHVFFTQARNSFDESLAKAIMQFVQKREAKFIDPDPLVVVEGFRDPRGKFDALAAVSSEVHQMWTPVNKRVTDLSINLYPIYRCELSGDEDKDQLSVIIPRLLPVSSWNRDPHPIAWIRFADSKTGVKSKGKGYGLDSADTFYEAIGDMKKDGSFAEAKNFRGQLLRVEYRERSLWVMPPEGPERKVTKKAALELAQRFLTEGL